MLRKRGQAANESAMLIMMILVVVVFFMAVLANNLSEVNEQNYKNLLEETAAFIKAETDITFQAAEGYYHAFTLPPKVGARPYTVEFINATVIERNGSVIRVHAEQGDTSYFAEKVVSRDVLGNLVRGKNTVRKEDGLVIFRPIPLEPSQIATCSAAEAAGTCSQVSQLGVTREECCDHTGACC